MNIAALISWYQAHRRPLPWRQSRDTYRIWLSEVMLQQTTTTAVIPYYENFLAKFPTLGDLARASEAEVLAAWAGLGYYRRAKLLHQSSKAVFARGGFPRTSQELAELPGFGPYTSRSVASLAHGENVGVVDGNVIRVVCRLMNWNIPWWTTLARAKIQRLVDEWVQGYDSADFNQAMMELGATICTPRSPTCVLCPLHGDCQSQRLGRQTKLPRPRPRRSRENWCLKACLIRWQGKVALVHHDHWPVLKNTWLPPGQARRVGQPPKTFAFKHSITHHDLFVQVIETPAKRLARPESIRWCRPEDISHLNPASLVKKIVTWRPKSR